VKGYFLDFLTQSELKVHGIGKKKESSFEPSLGVNNPLFPADLLFE
jgi:hypothetical protein